MNIYVTHDHGYVLIVVIAIRSFPHSWLIAELVTRITWRIPLLEQELFTRPEHLSSHPVFSKWGSCCSLFLFRVVMSVAIPAITTFVFIIFPYVVLTNNNSFIYYSYCNITERSTYRCTSKVKQQLKWSDNIYH